MASWISTAHARGTSASAMCRGVVLSPGDLEADTPICRICYAGASSEQLLHPCHCRGSLRFVHRSCLEHWLSTTGGDVCELCRRRYDTVRTPKSCWQWIRHGETRDHRCQMMVDLVCFLILAFMLLGGACAVAEIYLQTRMGFLETAVLGGLAAILLYLFYECLRMLCAQGVQHYATCRQWRAGHFNVRVVDLQSPLGSEGTDGPTPGESAATSSQPLIGQGGALPAQTGPSVSGISLLYSDRPSCS